MFAFNPGSCEVTYSGDAPGYSRPTVAQECDAIMAPVTQDKLMSMIDSDKLVDGYTEEIELLFDYHGDQYKIGETESHENATENEYASDAKTYIWLDPDTY